MIGSYTLLDVKYLINSNISLSRKLINLYISYKLYTWSRNLNTDFTLSNCLFGAVKLTKNNNPDKYEYSDYDIGFDERLQFSLPDGSSGENVIIFWFDNSSSLHVDNKKNDILVLSEGPIQWLADTTIKAEAKYPINFTQSGKNYVTSALQWK